MTLSPLDAAPTDHVTDAVEPILHMSGCIAMRASPPMPRYSRPQSTGLAGDNRVDPKASASQDAAP